MSLTLSARSQRPAPTDAAASARGTLVRGLLGALSTAYLTLLGSLLASALLPTLWGWSTFVVASDSMAPAVRAGDVLVTSQAGPQQVRPGFIVVVDDPGTPGRLLSHRVVEVHPDGDLVTRGDANASADSTPVAPEALRGLARARVPYVGLAKHWAERSQYGALAGWLLLTCGAVAGAATDPYRRSRRRGPGPSRLLLQLGGRRLSRSSTGAAILLVGVPLTAAWAAAATGQPGVIVHAALKASTLNGSNTLSSAADWTPPTATRAVIAKSTTGYLAGSVKPNGTYRVYAQVTDTGNPASAVGVVEADVRSLTAGPVWTALPSGSFTIQGLGYNYGSAALTASTTAGSKNWSLRMTDGAGNVSPVAGYSVTVDGTAPQAAAVDTVNNNTIVGRPQTNDVILLDFTEQIDPFSVFSGWTGASMTVTVRMVPSSGTLVTVIDPGTAGTIPLGSIQFTNTFVAGTRNYTGSTMVQSGSRITLTLGTGTGSAAATDALNSPATWTPSTANFDAAGNLLTGPPATEPGPADPDF